MSLGTIKNGPYGKFYAYTHNGQSKNLGIKDQGINLTPEQLDELIENGKLNFNFNGMSIYAELVEYFNKKFGKQSQFIKYTVTGVESAPTSLDLSILEAQKAQIIFYYSDNTFYYAKTKTEAFLKTLKLSKTYLCGNIDTEVPGIIQVAIYYGMLKDLNDPSKHAFRMYLKSGSKNGYKTEYHEITHSQYIEELNEYNEQQRLKKEKYDAAQEAYIKNLELGISWMKNIVKQIWGDSDRVSKTEIVKALESIVSGVPATSNMEFLLKNPPTNTIKDLFGDIDTFVKYYIHNYNSDADLEKMKTYVLSKLRKYYDYYRVKTVRTSLYESVKSNGLESVVDSVDIDQALDLGRFKNLKSVLLKKISSPIKHICMNMFIDITEPEELKRSLLYMLKTYHAFFDFPTKDIKAIAKFIAVHDIKEYQEKMLEYDTAIETIIDYGKPSFRKRALMSIAGGTRIDMSFLKTKSFYFEKEAAVRDDITINDPMRLLDELRELIPVYNIGSDVAILTNIELKADSTFIYQFYTFSDSASGDDMDGRRVQYIARLYNKNHSNHIYFKYNK